MQAKPDSAVSSFPVGCRVFAKHDIVTVFVIDGDTRPVMDAWAGENGTVEEIFPTGFLHVRFEKGLTMCSPSELGYVD